MPKVGRGGQRTGFVGKSIRTGKHGRGKSRHASAETTDQNRTKIAYPTTTTTTTTTT